MRPDSEPLKPQTPPPPPPPPPASWSGSLQQQEREAKAEAIYRECLEKGKCRFVLMQRRSDPQPKDYGIFRDNYNTEILENNYSPTHEALRSQWNEVAKDSNYYYENTPLPHEGKLFSWQNNRADKEPLTNADIYFFQYLYQHNRDNQGKDIPPLRVLQRQQARSETFTAVSAFIRSKTESKSDDKNLVFHSGDDAFNAILGSQNGTASCFLVVHYGDKLKISMISSIILTSNENLIFNFST